MSVTNSDEVSYAAEVKAELRRARDADRAATRARSPAERIEDMREDLAYLRANLAAMTEVAGDLAREAQKLAAIVCVSRAG